jgi:hypothetical protein
MAVVYIYKGIGKTKGKPLILNEAAVYPHSYFDAKFKSIYQNSYYNVGDILIRSFGMMPGYVITLYSDDNNTNIINTYTESNYELKEKNIRSITISKKTENFSLNEHFLGKEGKFMLVAVIGPFIIMFILCLIGCIFLQEPIPTRPTMPTMPTKPESKN